MTSRNKNGDASRGILMFSSEEQMGDPGVSCSPKDLGGELEDDLADDEYSVDKGKHCNVKKSRDPLWKGYNCCVPLCRHSYGEQKERIQLHGERLSFHSFPSLSDDKERAQEWIARIRRDPGREFVINKYTKICNKHFIPEDFACGGGDPLALRRVLKKIAIPSVFPWQVFRIQRTTVTSQLARGEKLRGENYVQVPDHEDITECHISEDGGSAEFDNVDTDYSDITSDSTEIERLQMLVADLSEKVATLQAKYDKALFRLENIKDDNDLVHFYTGFPDYDTLLTFYKIVLEEDAKVMRQWRSGQSKESYAESKSGRNLKLPLLEQFFLTLVRLRLGLLEVDLAHRFGVSQTTVSRIIMTWINLLYHNLKGLERYPPWHVVKNHMPDAFKEQYPNTRLIIDATEFGIERPSSLVSQSCTFSSYKNKNTVKVLIGINPNGAIVFVSPTYEGSISDKKLVKVSGLLEKLEVGDEIMADKGFDIQDMLTPHGVKLNIPPFLSSGTQFSCENVMKTKKIAKLRIHVERAIERVKEFRILRTTIPVTMWDSINELIYVCAWLCNFGPPLCISNS